MTSRRLFKRMLPVAVMVALGLALCSVPAFAKHRAALLIGNSQYQDRELVSTIEDTQTVAEAVEKLGFRTTLKQNAGKKELPQIVESFAGTVPTRGTALVYFAGYAMQGEKDGTQDNFLLPVDAKVGKPRDVGHQGLGVQQLLSMLREKSGASQIVLVIDGCYQYPGRSDELASGLMPIEELAADTLIVLGCSPGSEIAAGEGSSALADAMQSILPKTNASANEIFATIADTVEKQTDGRRQPWLATSLEDDVQISAKTRTEVVAPPEKVVEGRRAGDEWVNARGIVFCWCPPGEFTMGSPAELPDRRDDEGPVEVKLSRGFWIGKYELTRRESTRVPRNAIATDANHPVDGIHFDDIKSVLRDLNQTEKEAGRLPSGWEYTLPTEAEWEYACRAGSNTSFPFGSDVSKLPQHANFADRSLLESRDDFYHYAPSNFDDGVAFLAPVGSYEPNAWGIHDMCGNLWEFCWTRYSQQLKGGTDPQGPKQGSQVLRGGSWCSLPGYCRSAFRSSASTRTERNFIGYRLVLRRK